MDVKVKEDLEAIRRMMEESRREVVDRGKYFLVWGVIGAVGSGATYAWALGWAAIRPAWLWLGLIVAGWAGSWAVTWGAARGDRVRTVGRRLLRAFWGVSALAATLVVLSAVLGGVVDPPALPGLLAVFIGAAVVVTGVLAGHDWLMAVGVGWWVGGGVMLLVPGAYTLVLMGALSLFLMAVPGGLLYRRSRRAETR